MKSCLRYITEEWEREKQGRIPNMSVTINHVFPKGSIYEALYNLKSGKKVWRQSWNPHYIKYLQIRPDMSVMAAYAEDDLVRTYGFTISDIEASDWEEVNT